MKKVTLILLASFLFGGDSIQTELIIAFWNVENLFDTTDDLHKKDNEFLPTGKKEYTDERLNFKFERLTQVVLEQNNGQGPDILGLAEVENRDVLERWIQEYLRINYQIVHRESSDQRGIDVALFVREGIKIIDKRWLDVPIDGKPTREILEATIEIQNLPLTIFVNHWPSRRGGQEETEPKRVSAAKTLRQRIVDILQDDPNADLVIMGDLNDDPDNTSILNHLQADGDSTNGGLFNTTCKIWENPNRGTLKYKNKWNTYDQIIVSEGLLDNHGFTWVVNSTQEFKKDYLINDSGRYKGYPWRWYSGNNWLKGYSDHLLVYCKISM